MARIKKANKTKKTSKNVEVVSSTSKELTSVSTSKELTTYRSLDPSVNALSAYLKKISRHPMLSPEQEEELIKAFRKTGDIDLAKKLVLANLRLVVKIAMEYRSTWQNVMDLIQEGNIGLMKAVSKYDDSKGAKLSYYASWWIKSYILKYILDNFRLVKIGTTNEQKKLFYNLMKEKNRLIAEGITPDVKNISQNLGVSEKSVALMDQRLSPEGSEVSLDMPAGKNDGRDMLLGELIPDESNSNVEDDIASRQEVELLKTHMGDFLSTLKERDLEIFKNRLLREVPLSLQEIADHYGVSRERIRQVEARLLKNLKVYMSRFIR